MAGKNLLATVLLVCGLLTAGIGIYIVSANRSFGERWPDAGPLMVDKTGTLELDGVDRIWQSADELWRSNRVLLSLMIASTELSGADRRGDEFGTSNEASKPPLRMSVSL